MLLIGCTPRGRHIEQHDMYFGIGDHISDLIPDIISFWPEAKGDLHIDAFVPQSSAEELLALYDAGVLSMVPVDADSKVVPGQEEGIIYCYHNQQGELEEVKYRMFIDCIGQPPLAIEDIPFKGLVENYTISRATLRFRSEEEALKIIEEGNKEIEQDSNGNYYLNVPGIMINDYFQVVDNYGAANNRIFVMAVPYIGGVNPDYSGLDFCEAASARIIKRLGVLQS